MIMASRPFRFEVPRLTDDQKIGILSSDSLLIPFTLNTKGKTAEEGLEEAISSQEMKQLYLVHMKIGDMTVTVYTSEDADDEEHDDDAASDGQDSADLEDVGEEFTVP